MYDPWCLSDVQVRHTQSTAKQITCSQGFLRSAEREMQHVLQQVLETYQESDADRAEESHMDTDPRSEAIRYRRVMQNKVRASQRAWLRIVTPPVEQFKPCTRTESQVHLRSPRVKNL